MKQTELIFGFHAVTSALRKRPADIRELWVDKGRADDRIHLLLETAGSHNIRVHHVNKSQLDSLVSNGNHQSIIANCVPDRWLSEHELKLHLARRSQHSVYLALDCVQDPHNLGACLRSADGAGVDGVLLPKDRSVGLTSVVRKVACGATESVQVYQVTNLVRSLREMQEQGYWVYGLDAEATQSIFEVELAPLSVLVLGTENKGLRRLTRETCDALIKIPMAGQVESLNVSVATGICLFEVMRQQKC